MPTADRPFDLTALDQLESEERSFHVSDIEKEKLITILTYIRVNLNNCASRNFYFVSNAFSALVLIFFSSLCLVVILLCTSIRPSKPTVYFKQASSYCRVLLFVSHLISKSLLLS